METLRLTNLALQLIRLEDAIAINFDHVSDAVKATKQWELHFAAWARAWGSPYLEIRVNGKRHCKISANITPEVYGMSELPPADDEPVIKPPFPEHLNQNLFGADYVALWEFCLEQYKDGNIVIITDNQSNICLHTNDRLKPERAYWSAKDFDGYDYLKSWRRDRNRTAADGINPQYFDLKRLLERDHYVPDYEYELFRPDDALVSYSTSYYLCQNYQGREVRIGVSKPEMYQVLSEV